ncbi:peroxisome assembly protein per8 [Crepidotus variabilis]|uniref:RING-type E3 ubiquitin transferase n=1 Tax=Crepidotus variabilis TaxID=179855 RepID=A0A9P6ET88_9AGAR|nr:peroxisome assembly protein per8 [Crepidotus variabilis]
MSNDPSSSSLSFPRAQQAQIIRANQRDLYHVASLRDQADNVLRSWMGTRWLSRWDKELDLLIKLCYFGLTTGRATQTLGEEYTDTWQYSSRTGHAPPSPAMRAALLALSLGPSYIFGRWGQSASLNESHPTFAKWIKRIPTTLDIVMELNLAVFYLRGTYYDLTKRLLGIQHLSSIPDNPHIRPPSYSLLGVMITVRLLHRLALYFRERSANSQTLKGNGKKRLVSSLEMYLDDRPLSTLLDGVPEGDPARPAEEDEGTALAVTAIPDGIRASRNCTLCLEERTDSCATECGHLFCWNCIVGWGREKPECPLCRQALSLDKLLPIYNL